MSVLWQQLGPLVVPTKAGAAPQNIITARTTAGTSRTDFGAPIGFYFETRYDLLITQIGLWKISGSGTHRVAVYSVADNVPTEIVGETIDFSGASAGFVYNTLATPYSLPAGTYFIASTFATSGDPWDDNNSVLTFDSDFTLGGPVYYASGKWQSDEISSKSLTVPNLAYTKSSLKNLLVNGDFEIRRVESSANLTSGTGVKGNSYVSVPPDFPGWTFLVSAGVRSNTDISGYNSPAGQHGFQAAFLQWGTSEMSQTFSCAAGTYTLTFKFAQRVGTNASWQVVELYVDNVLINTYSDHSSAIWFSKSESLTLSAGSHTIKFKGTNPNGGDNTAFIDNVVVI